MIKTVKWNGKELHVVEWLFNNELEWMFLGSEVVEALEYKLDSKTTYTKYINRHCTEKECLKVKSKEIKENLNPTDIDGLNISRNGEIFITELGVYSLIFGSNMPEAKNFKQWVFTLLKQLRENSGLEQYEAFRMMDKEVQKSISQIMNEVGDLESYKNVIVGNQKVNKIISEFFSFDKPLNKNEMETFCKEMLIDRQEVLRKYSDNLIIVDGSHTQADKLTRKWFKFNYKQYIDENNLNF